MKNSFLILVLTLFALIFQSCEEDSGHTAPQLTVYVTNATNNNPRTNTPIRIFTSETDANNRVNSLDFRYTNINGEAVFYNLVAYRTYWVQVESSGGQRQTRQITLYDDRSYMNFSVF